MENQPEPTIQTSEPEPNENRDISGTVAEKNKPPSAPTGPWRHWRRFKSWYGSRKKWSIPATITLLIVILGLVPWTRYHTTGLVLKKDFTIQVSDSTANTPVSGALVVIGGISGTTNGSGQVKLHSVKVGQHAVTVTKKYYQDKHADVLVPILKEKTTPNISFVATGRQVLIKITNTVSGKVLGDVQIAIADTTAKTASDGTATVVVPANSASQKATLSLNGYNDAAVVVKVSNQKTQENDFKLTPAGKIYFLSTRTGSIDLMKANLDGSNAETVIGGTGNEQNYGTFVSESPDGKYVALVSKRTTTDATPQLYVLSTADDQLLQADSGNAYFTMYGWVGDSLIYTVSHQDMPAWQQGLNKLKSYDATTGKNTLLDQSAGSDSTAAANENYQLVMISGNNVIYGKVWYGDNLSTLVDKQNSLQMIGASGQSHQGIITYPVNDSVSFSQHSPVGVYIADTAAGSSTPTYYDYTVGSGAPKQVTIDYTQFYNSNSPYFFSPSGNQTFWSEPRDGKNTLLLADNSGANAKTIQNLSDYGAQGWYSNYLLVSKNASELYVMDTQGDTPVKVTDYQPGTFAL